MRQESCGSGDGVRRICAHGRGPAADDGRDFYQMPGGCVRVVHRTPVFQFEPPHFCSARDVSGNVATAGLPWCERCVMRQDRRMPDAVLADLLGRLSVALAAGIDLRRAWAGEVARAPAAWRPRMEEVARGLAEGSGLAESMGRAGAAFPPLVRGMVAVGDETGHEAETLREIAELLHRTVRAARALRGSLVWPAFQLAVALAVVGFLILIAGFIRDSGGGAVDVLGIGLTGVGGLLRYVVIVVGLLAAGAVALKLAVGNWRRHGFVRTVVDRVPIIGAAARAAEAAAWCRAASLASGAGLDARRLVHLSSTAAPGLWLDADAIERRLRSGATLEEALRASGRFPRRVLEAVAVGELTGNTAEVLDRLAGQCDEEARHGFEAAARVAGFLAWAAVAALIVTVIFRIFSFYVAAIQDAAGGL